MVILRNAKNSNGAPEGAPQPPRIMVVTTTIRTVMVVSTTTLTAKILQTSGKRTCSQLPECSISYTKILQQQTPQKDKILHSSLITLHLNSRPSSLFTRP